MLPISQRPTEHNEVLTLAEIPTRLLIVDDSALYRQTINNALRTMEGVTIVGVAKNGIEALEKVDELDPDLLTLDVQMPDMDGIATLREMNRRRLRAKAIMVSSLTSEGARVTTDALLEGAFDFILKPSGRVASENHRDLFNALDEKITAFRASSAARKKQKRRSRRPIATVAQGEVVEETPASSSVCRAVLIATSTGGPAALKVVLPRLPVDIGVPVLVVQHMPAQYTRSLAMRLDELCEVTVQEAADGDEVRSGSALIAPGGQQMKLEGQDEDVVARLTDDPPENGCRPSADYMFRYAAKAFGGNVLAVVMTGMGRDGTDGCSEIKRRGGIVFAQHGDGCAVYGMPKATIDEGLADRVLPLGKIAPAIIRHIKRCRQSGHGQ